jgi:glyoxylase-like metal-dependent hydrolase (beta-lactamase superfamily II)
MSRRSSVVIQAALVAFIGLWVASAPAEPKPDWCKPLPRPEYRSLERVKVKDPWFEVYKVVPGVLAIYEPKQAEETIGYLILGSQRALLFDTGMGISDLKGLVAHLTRLPVMVLNSHTHNDHVGDNWRFDSVYSMDTEFSRLNAEGSREDAQAEVGPGQLCGALPPGFRRDQYRTRPWKIAGYIHDGQRIDLGQRTLEVVATPGHTPDAISLFDAANGLLFTGDTYYPGQIWLFRPETDLQAYRQSVQRLVALAPRTKWVLGAHNVPIANPEVLSTLAGAFDKVQAGEVTPTPAGEGKVTYKVEGIRFLMKAPVR